MTNAYNPPGSVLPQHWDNNKESFLAYMEESFKGIRGIVLDAGSGKPVWARIDVLQISDSPVFCDSSVGDYHRMLLPGVYDLEVSAAGYLSQTLHAVTVADTGATRVDVALERDPNGVSEEASATPVSFSLGQNYPNPFNPSTEISIQLSAVREVTLRVYDMLGRELATLVNERKSTGHYTVTFDASGLASGVYLYRLTAGDFIQTRKMVLVR